MRILYLAADPLGAPKGAGVRIARTVATLRELGHEVESFTPALAGAGPSADTVQLPQENFLDRMMAFRDAAAAWLADREADCIAVRSIWEGIPALARARRIGAALIYEAHGFPSVELPYHFPGLEHDDAVMSKLIGEETALLSAAARVLTPSQTGRRFLLVRGVRPARIAIVPNAVDLSLFTPPAEAPAAEPPYRLIYVGTQAPWQGLDTLLEALVPYRHQALVELHVVGPAKGVWRRRLRSLARRLRVHHLLHLSGAMSQENLVPVLHTAHVCVAPLPADARNTLQGCCPIKVLEYMAAARPILATRVAPIEELMTHGRDGHLVRPGSPRELAAGIAWLLEHADEREELGRQARQRVAARYDPKRFRERLAAAFSEGA